MRFRDVCLAALVLVSAHKAAADSRVAVPHAQQHRSGPEASADKVDAAWIDAVTRARLLLATDDVPGADAIYVEFLTAHPKYGPAHEMVAERHWTRAHTLRNTSANAALRARLLELAATHYRQAAALAAHTVAELSALSSAIRLYGAQELNRPAEGEALARSAIVKHPREPRLQYQLVEMQLSRATPQRAENILRTAREAIAATSASWKSAATFMWEIVRNDPALPPHTAEKVLVEAHSMLDEALRLKGADTAGILGLRAMVLRLQARRVEQDPARAKALVDQADRHYAEAEKLQRKP
jgi:hypothetical protein